MIRITREFQFDYGHRVLGHGGKCRHIHGHRGVAQVSVEAPQLDALGFVIDFSNLKTIVGDWIDTFWDHNIILNGNDPLARMYVENTGEDTEWGFFSGAVFADKTPYVLPAGMNPTAENLAKILAEKAQELLAGSNLKVVHVRLYETPNCWADYDL